MNVQYNPHLTLSPDLIQARAARQQNMQAALLDPSVNVATFGAHQAAAYRGYGADVMMNVSMIQNFCMGFPPLPPFGGIGGMGGMGMGNPYMGMMDPFMGMGFMPPMGMGGPMMGGMAHGFPGMMDQSMMIMMMMMQQDMMMQILMMLVMQQGQNPDQPHVPPVDGGDQVNPTDPEGGDQEKKMTPVRAAEILLQYAPLLDTAAGIGEKDGLIGIKDLKEALKNPDIPEELRQAIEYVLNNPMVLNALDVASGKGKVDGLISVGDLENFIKDNKGKPGVDVPEGPDSEAEVEEAEGTDEAGEVTDPETAEEELKAIDAARALLENFDTVAKITGRKGQIERQDLLEVVTSTEYPEDLKAAAQFFVDNPDVFKEICKSGFLSSSKRATKKNLERWIKKNS